jgi:hypothetical protein
MAMIEPIADLMRKRRLQWYGHVLRRGNEVDIMRVAEMKVLGKRKRGRPKQRWIDTIKSALMRIMGLHNDALNRERWLFIFCPTTPTAQQPHILYLLIMSTYPLHV